MLQRNNSTRNLAQLFFKNFRLFIAFLISQNNRSLSFFFAKSYVDARFSYSMSGYPTIRNPLLPSPPTQQRRFRKSDLFSNLSISSSAGLKSSISNASLRSFMSQTIHSISHVSSTLRINKRIMPVPPTKSVSIDNFQHHQEPIVHYNGPYHTWESLPEEKLLWIKDEQTAACVRNPLSSYNKSIVLRKPLTRSKTL